VPPAFCPICDQTFEFAVDFRDSIRRARFENRVRWARRYDGARGVIFAPLRFRFELALVLHPSYAPRRARSGGSVTNLARNGFSLEITFAIGECLAS
jgi:hypothetical protein